MNKSLFIAEKPSVAQEFAKALHEPMTRKDGFLESEHAVVTWCVGHLVTMSYPEVYDPALKKWRMETLPFIPDRFLYEVIPSVAKQFAIVKGLLNRVDISCIYVCTDSGREGEYIYRLVEQEAGTSVTDRRRVWIDSQTEEEIQKGIKNARPLSEYDALADAAYLRAKEDYLMGINFSRLLAIRYGNQISDFLGSRSKLAVGRVMTCVLGMVVRREREIREFVKTPFYRLIGTFSAGEGQAMAASWRVCESSPYWESPHLYKENGFLEESRALALAEQLRGGVGEVTKLSRRKEKNNAPLLFNLAELQNTCAKQLKISPDETLRIAQELYEKKLITYPRTDARVLSTAIAKEIRGNISGLSQIRDTAPFVKTILEEARYKGIEKSRYTNDKMITDHYAIIPTGQGLSALADLSQTARGVYERIVRRFLAIFYPPAVYEKTELSLMVGTELFEARYKLLLEEGYLAVSGLPTKKKNGEEKNASEEAADEEQDGAALAELLHSLKKGTKMPLTDISAKQGETAPPKRYTSGSLILAMENAGQLIEDEDLRAQIKGSGIGTSATRAEILKKLVTNDYLKLNKKTQTVAPSLLGELIYETVYATIRPLLNPELTASWEMGLTRVADGTISETEYMEKLRGFIVRQTDKVKENNVSGYLVQVFRKIREEYEIVDQK